MARVLVVDDDPVIIKLYQIILKNAGFDVEVAITGEDLLVAVSGQKPDVILLDVILPDYSGLELCSHIKNNPDLSGIKVILVSGMEIAPSQVAEGIEIGADDYLVKPFDPKVLLARIRSCVKLKIAEEALKDKNNELQKLSSHLQNIREEERKSLAREVQEEVGQLAAVLKMDIDWLYMNMPDTGISQKNRIVHASDTAKLVIHTIRKIASALRPSMLDELGLNASLEWLCKEFASQHNIPCIFHETVNDAHLSGEIKTALFRICQESLRNISQHAGATEISVNAIVSETDIRLNISDNGKGFDVELQKDALGLISMRERAKAINGDLQMESEPGKGTTISVIVPIHSPKK